MAQIFVDSIGKRHCLLFWKYSIHSTRLKPHLLEEIKGAIYKKSYFLSLILNSSKTDALGLCDPSIFPPVCVYINRILPYLSFKSVDKTTFIFSFCRMNTRIKTMGTYKSKHLKKEENGTTKDTVAKNDFNHGDASDLTGNLNKTGNTSQGLGSAPRLSHQMQPDGGNEELLTRIHQAPSKVLVKMPGDDDESSQLTAETTVTTVQEGSQEQDCTAMEENTTKIHNKAYHTPQHNKVDNDTNGNTSSGIQTVSMKPALDKGRPSADPNNAANNPTVASADSSVKSKLQHKLNVTLILHTAVKPKEKSKLKGMEQNHPNKNAGNITEKEDKNGKNGQDEKQEPNIPPAVPPEHTEGRWHPFTVNQSCSVKVLCKHNPGKDLPPNIQKW